MATSIPDLTRNEETGLSDSTHSSTSSSASRYALDGEDPSPILLYNYRGALSTSSQKDLCGMLDKNESLRVTRKPIPRYTSYLDVKRHDLFLPDEREAYRDFPNYDSSLASVKIPLSAYWSKMLWSNAYKDLYIVSPESSPASSVAGSQESRNVSPMASFKAGE